MVEFIVMQVHHAYVYADEGNLDWCKSIDEDILVAQMHFLCIFYTKKILQSVV